MSGRYHALSQLPEALSVFPLSGVLLLPRGNLPLNVFEPRYLAMVDFAFFTSRLIGMIQPAEPEEAALKPALQPIGCAGRITSYRETEDGRYLITLTGICRFRMTQEIETGTPFRQVRASYEEYAADLEPPDDTGFPREDVIHALKAYLSRRDLKADWQSVTSAPAETLVNALAMLCPFEPAEKQALLEAKGWDERVAVLVALLEMAGASTGSESIN